MKVRACDVSENLVALFDIVGEDQFLEITKMYGGNNLYIPTYKSALRHSRNRDIIKKYNGVNSVQLAHEYGISVNQLKSIINESEIL